MNYLLKLVKISWMLIVTLMVCLLLIIPACNKKHEAILPDDYHIVWNTQSKNAAESMPLVGGDIGCNVWVENGDLLLYVQRSGSLSEIGDIRSYLSFTRCSRLINFNWEMKRSRFSKTHMKEHLHLEKERLSAGIKMGFSLPGWG